MNSTLKAIRTRARARSSERLLSSMFCTHSTRTMYRTHDGYNRYSCNDCKRMVVRKELS